MLIGPFVRDAAVSAVQRALLRAAMAPPWAAQAWKSYLPKLYAGRRPADFGEYRDQVAAALRRPGYASAFSRTTRTSHAAAQARLADVSAPALVVMGEQDPTSRTPRQKLTGLPALWAAGSSWCPRPATIPSHGGPTSPPEPSCASSSRYRTVLRPPGRPEDPRRTRRYSGPAMGPLTSKGAATHSRTAAHSTTPRPERDRPRRPSTTPGALTTALAHIALGAGAVG